MARKRKQSPIRRRALQIDQNGDSSLYVFALTADELGKVADISRISRDDAGKLLGYQRPEVRKHVQEITEYLDSAQVIFPNPIILAFEGDVKFIKTRGPQVEEGVAAAGTLEIPLPGPGQRPPAWIVDGQQRALALSRVKRRDFPIPVNGFVAKDLNVQRDQFIRINNSKPLPRGLLTELLPESSGPLPAKLAARKVPAALADLLNRDSSSPFHGMIRQSSMTAAQRKKAPITDTSVVKMIEESFGHPSGCLFPHRDIGAQQTDTAAVFKILCVYWQAVRETFPEAWGKSPQKSRLMGGVGIRSMGRLMDKIMPGIDITRPDAVKRVRKELETIQEECHWTNGHWDGLGGLAWNELQNVPRHVSELTSFLIRTYVQNRGYSR